MCHSSDFQPSDSFVSQLFLITHKIYKSFDANPSVEVNSNASIDLLGILFSAGDFRAGAQKDNCEPWGTIFIYKHVWMVWVVYYGKLNYYVFINCIRHCVRGEFIQNYF